LSTREGREGGQGLIKRKISDIEEAEEEEEGKIKIKERGLGKAGREMEGGRRGGRRN